jgi:hypothetical protein
MPLLREVITSWQVIAVTIALIFYLNIVFYVSRTYHRPRFKLSGKIKFKKKPKPDAVLPVQKSEEDSGDDLGLEED